MGVPTLHQRLRAAELIERAQRRTGFADFGDAPFRAGLEAFLRACTEEAELSLFGKLGTRWDVLRFLSNLLRLRAEEIGAPEIVDQPIERPVFITGLPRSGTTFLHRLLIQDPGNAAPLVWQTIHPYPVARTGRADRRRQTVSRQLRMFEALAPELRRLHPIAADTPQECSEITAHVFASTRFDTTYFVPSYRSWLEGVGQIEPYRFHKRFLQHLQHQSGAAPRWVLKCPDHVFVLDAIRAVYPDARLVFVHRDPLRVLPSLIRLTEVLRRPFTRKRDRGAIARDASNGWLAGTELMIAAAKAEPFAEPIFHLHYRALVENPLGAVRALYHHFGIALDDDAVARMGQMIEATPNGGYGANHYRFEDCGLDPAVEAKRFRRYVECFGIASETAGAERG